MIKRAKKKFKLIIFKKIKYALFKKKVKKIIINIKINTELIKKKSSK